AGLCLGSSSWDGTSRLWDSISGHQLMRFDGVFSNFNVDGTRIAIQKGLELSISEVVLPSSHRWLSRGMTCSVSIATGGRLMASCHDDGVRLWDLERLVELAHLPIGIIHGVAFHPSLNGLLIASEKGLFQFPIHSTNDNSGTVIQFGTPSSVEESLRNLRSVHLSSDGKAMVADAFYRNDPWLFAKTEVGWQRRQLHNGNMSREFGGSNTSMVALSADGQWAAASSNGIVRIWQADTGLQVADLSTNVGEISNSLAGPICFSPDSRTLITISSSQLQIWDVASWTLRNAVSFEGETPWVVAFTPDNQMAAVSIWGVGITLIDVQAGRRVGMLDMPERPPVHVDLKFTQDGSQLVAAADHSGCCVWDIRAMREQLAAMGLDWNQTPLSERNTVKAKTSMRVEFNRNDLAPFAK
ncbi:MAG: WD40 repeat domain-containing protein, partial [Pirellula sp.]